MKYIKYKGKTYKSIDADNDDIIRLKCEEVSKRFIQKCKDLYICRLRNVYDEVEGTIQTYSGQFENEDLFKAKMQTLGKSDFDLKEFVIKKSELRQQGSTFTAKVKFRVSDRLYHLLVKKYAN